MARFELQKLYIDGGYTDAGSDATLWSAPKRARKSGPR
jgi:hypothetical protein